MGTEVASDCSVRRLGELAVFDTAGGCLPLDRSRTLFRFCFIVPYIWKSVLKMQLLAHPAAPQLWSPLPLLLIDLFACIRRAVLLSGDLGTCWGKNKTKKPPQSNNKSFHYNFGSGMTKRSLSHILKLRKSCVCADPDLTCTQKAFLKIMKVFGFNGWHALGYMI